MIVIPTLGPKYYCVMEIKRFRMSCRINLKDENGDNDSLRGLKETEYI